MLLTLDCCGVQQAPGPTGSNLATGGRPLDYHI
jgi:hypothetical protein